MDVFEAVRTVLAVRAFQNKAVPAETIERILEAGRLTASGNNLQPWDFIIVQDRDDLRKLREIIPTGGPYIAECAFLVVVVVSNSEIAVSDGSRAIQSMILTAWAEGVGSNWVGFARNTAVNTMLNIPENLNVLAVLPFGYPAQAIGHGIKKRKPATEVVHRGRFGTH